MTTQKAFLRFLLIGFFVVITPACVLARDVVVGVDLPTVDRMSPDDQEKMLNALHSAGVHVIRTWIANDSSYAFIKKAFDLGITVRSIGASLSSIGRMRGNAPRPQ